MGRDGCGILPAWIRRAIFPVFVWPAYSKPAARKQKPGSRFGRTLFGSTNVIIPCPGGFPHVQRVIPMASRISRLESSWGDSFRKSVQTQAPGQACFVYSG